jgi:hypothetical protein
VRQIGAAVIAAAHRVGARASGHRDGA